MASMNNFGILSDYEDRLCAAARVGACRDADGGSAAPDCVFLDPRFEEGLRGCVRLCNSEDPMVSGISDSDWSKEAHRCIRQLAIVVTGNSLLDSQPEPATLISLDSIDPVTARVKHKYNPPSGSAGEKTVTEAKQLSRRGEKDTLAVYAVHLMDVRAYIVGLIALAVEDDLLTGKRTIESVRREGPGTDTRLLCKFAPTWPMMPKQSTKFVTVPMPTDAKAMEQLYAQTQAWDAKLCVNDGISISESMLCAARTSVNSSSTTGHVLRQCGPDFVALHVLLLEYAQVLKSKLYPICFKPDATLEDMVNTAVTEEHGLLDASTGFGGMSAMCHLPAKSVIVDGCVRLYEVFRQVAYPDEPGPIVADPSNYRFLLPGRCTKDFAIYDNPMDSLASSRRRYGGLCVLHGELRVEYVHASDAASVWRLLRATTTNGNAAKVSPVYISRVNLEYALGKCDTDAELAMTETLRAGDVFVWDNKCPVLLHPQNDKLCMCVDLDYFPLRQLTPTQYDDRAKCMLSGKARSRRTTSSWNVMEWAAMCSAATKWGEYDNHFHPYTVHKHATQADSTPAAYPLYYQHIPNSLVDQLRGVQLYGQSMSCTNMCSSGQRK